MYLRRIGWLAGVCCLVSCFDLQSKKGHYLVRNVGEATDLRVMTFNILSTLDLVALTDGYATWGERKRFVFEMIESQDPDLVSIQEASSVQFQAFRDHFSDHYKFAHNMALTTDAFIMYKKSRFTPIERGFWALEPAWQVHKIRRIAVWVKLREKDSLRELMLVGAHADAKTIKEKEIQDIKNRLLPQQASGAPLILAGDFNLASDSSYYGLLIGSGWKDTYTGDLALEVPTYPAKKPTRRIDHIVYFGEDVHPLSWEAPVSSGMLPSDHKPVVVNLHIDKAST